MDAGQLTTIIILITISALSIGIGTGFFIAQLVSPQWNIISVIFNAIGVIIAAVVLFKTLIKDLFDSRLKPRLRYLDKEIRVKNWDNHMFNTKFQYSAYYLTIKNTAPGIEAMGCKGKITVSDTDIEKREMLWELGKPSIVIGHDELLRLFEISETSERKTILFYRDPIEYNESMNERQILVKIQSENAECPTNAYEATIGDIIQQAH